MIFNGNEIGAGERNSIQIPVPGEENGSLDVILYTGSHPGKTLLISAGMHGNEYIGIEALARIVRYLDPKKMHGNVMILPLINPRGFYKGSKQVIPADGVNLNRVFPGDPKGSYTWKLAHLIEEEIYPHADFILDLHGGDANEDLLDLAFCNVEGTEEVNQMIAEVSKVLSVPYLVESHSVNGLYSWAVQKGIPGILLERGKRGEWEEEEILKEILDIEAVMIRLGIISGADADSSGRSGAFSEIYSTCQITRELIEGQNQVRKNRKMIRNAFYVDASADGFWYPQIRLGSEFKKGMLLGSVKDFQGNVLQEVYAEADGIVLYYTVALGVEAGNPLIAYGEL
ncbi:MAG: succinylglutamate desuccinylase/aspartoacylase family protein [Lachnospiraceae bacterium]|nr:succinylglutamate desuccinylase/aspartoacylase family protein [Lachnospiraceae bacterium]